MSDLERKTEGKVGVGPNRSLAPQWRAFPRDPNASARNTVNCGCASLPLMESWQVRHPGPRPFAG